VPFRWTQPEYRAWLLKDANPAIASIGYAGRQGEHLVVLENTPRRHNMVVCTLCSCYPWPVLGLPPVWYKSAPYRSRAVVDPRGVLKDFGVVELVHGCHVFPDSSALGAGENPQWLYAVRFSGRELWGADADPTTQVSVDAWEAYLERA